MRCSGGLLLICAASIAAAACYKYTPVQSPEPGMEVRAQLRTEAAVRRSQGLDSPILRYDGVVVDVSPESVSLDVLVARSTSAFQDITIRDTVRLETAEVQSLMRRQISPVKSALFALAAGAAAAAIVVSIDQVIGGTGEDDNDGGTPTIRIPVFGSTGRGLLPVLLRIKEE